VQEFASGGAKLTNIAPNPDASQGRALACPEAGVSAARREEGAMKQRRINATLTPAALTLTILILTALPLAGTAASRPEQQPSEPLVQSPVTTTRLSAALHSSPVMFIENMGQFDDRARFQVRGGMGTMWLAEDAIWVTVLEKPSSPQPPSPNLGEGGDFLPSPEFGRGAGGESHEDQPRKGVNLRLTFPGANPHLRIEPFNRLDIVVSYFIGNDPDQWHPDVPVWGGVRYVGLYSGVDLEITSQDGQWTWRTVASDGEALSQVRLRVDGADALILDGNALPLNTAVGDFTLPLLTVEGATPSRQPSTVNLECGTFEVSSPFSSVPLLPHSIARLQDNPDDLLYSTFLGGSDWDWGHAIAVDGADSAYVTGFTDSSGFPTTAGAFDRSYNSGRDVFVVKVNTTGTGLAYATFLGGSQGDHGYGIAVDGTGSTYVTGNTASSNFPTTAGAFDTSYNGGLGDAFMVKLNATGAALAYATFLGGSGEDRGEGITVDGAGSAYATGSSNSTDFPTTAGAFDRACGTDGNCDFSGTRARMDTFVVKLNAGGTGLAYATFLGGSGDDYGLAIAMDGAGSAYVTGPTCSSDFPTTVGAFDTSYSDNCDAFVVKFNVAGTELAYATFLGSSGGDLGEGIAVDGAGSAYVTGNTGSSNFPTTAGAFDTSHNGYYDAFVVRVNANGAGLVYATFLGGSSWDENPAIAVDRAGSAYVAGETYSSDFPTTAGAFDTTHNGGNDTFVVKLNATGSALAYATFLGGKENDYSGYGSGIAVDGAGSAYMTGFTGTSDFPTTPNAFDTSYSGYGDAFVAKLNPFSCDDVTEIPQAECEALVALYNSTNGANWSNNSGWLDTNTPCNWYGVTCSAGHVTRLWLCENQLSGSIPPQLDNLANLQQLWLIGNQLSGSIPPELGNLASLEDLHLCNNQFSGSIPPELGNLANLQRLDLCGNPLSGNIPPELGNLAGLRLLDLGGNQLSGSIPIELGNLTNLQDLFLSNNQLSGSIPPQLGDLANLQDLSLSSNQLSGSIPVKLSNLTDLRVLDLHGNQLIGSIPLELGNLANLQGLNLIGNQLSGSIPPELGNLTNLQWLSLGGNQLSGSIPVELGDLTNLHYLSLGGNQLSGSIPVELGDLTNLHYLSLGWNQLSGSIPPQLGNLTNLQYLELNSNQFSGALPGSLTNLTNLDTFWFNNTDLCEPADAAFQTWLASISNLSSTGIICPPADKPPVVLVHGWQARGSFRCSDGISRAGPEDLEHLWRMATWLQGDGFEEVWIAHLDTGLGGTPPLEDNAGCLKDQIAYVKQATRAQQVILIAHSMGGLVSRAYIEGPMYQNDVQALFTLGSPHAGIPSNWLKFLVGPMNLPSVCKGHKVLCQMTEERMEEWNQKYGLESHGVTPPYYVIGGDKSDSFWGRTLRFWADPNDGFVGTRSAQALKDDSSAIQSNVKGRYQTQESHSEGCCGYPSYFQPPFLDPTGQLRSQSYQCIQNVLLGTSNPCAGPSSAALAAPIALAAYNLTSYTSNVLGHLNTGETAEHTLQVDTDGASLFYLSWVTGTLGITLTNPVGTVIDPTYAAANTDVVTYTTSPGSEMTPPFAAYAFTTTVPGLYTATITAGDVGITGTDYLLFAAMETTRTMSVALDSDRYQIGDTAVLTATLEGAGGGIAGATVQATFSRSDTITDTLTLTDQGDGTYQGTYAIPNAPGYLHLRVTAEGSDAGTQFNRQVDRLLTVASQTVQLTGTYADRADDADGNGRYETLTVDVEVLAVGAGDFTFSADLVAGEGQFVAHVITQTALITGTQTVPLRFDGELIQDGGSDGPFTVTNLFISDPQNAGIPSVMADDVWTTAAYDHTQFGRITGDLDGNCVVNIVDIMLVASRWGTNIGDIRYDGFYDLDNSGNIDIEDIMLVAVHWRERCE
jgi:Leucine-rich repeat (LRR) protein